MVISTYQEGLATVKEFQNAASLLRPVDGAKGTDHLIHHAIGEILEALNEIALKQHDLNNRELIEFYKELADVFVFLACWLFHYTDFHPDSFDSDIGRLNGYGSHSNALERLAEIIPDLRTTPHQTMHEVLARLYSIGKHSPLGLHPLTYLDTVIEKVLGNRPPELYSAYENGVQLTDEECIAKYDHLEKCTRLLRKVVQRTLRSSDWIPYERLLLDWRNADAAFSELKERITKIPVGITEVPVKQGVSFQGVVSRTDSGLFVVDKPMPTGLSTVPVTLFSSQALARAA